VPLLGHEAVHLQVGRLDRVDVDELVQDRRHVVSGEGLLAAEHLERTDAKGEDVAAPVELVPHRLLGRHVRRRPQQRAGLSHLGVDQLGDPEVRDLHAVGVVEDQVGRLDVAVDDALGMGVIDCGRDLADQPDDLLRLEAQPTLDDRGDRLALDELHGQVGQAALFADVEQRHDVGVRQGPRDPRLVVEPLDEGLVLRALPGNVQADGLDRERALDEGVERLVDRTHRAVPDALLHLIPPDDVRHTLARVLVHFPA
jgi:hypothetical protein